MSITEAVITGLLIICTTLVLLAKIVTDSDKEKEKPTKEE